MVPNLVSLRGKTKKKDNKKEDSKGGEQVRGTRKSQSVFFTCNGPH